MLPGIAFVPGEDLVELGGVGFRQRLAAAGTAAAVSAVLRTGQTVQQSPQPVHLVASRCAAACAPRP